MWAGVGFQPLSFIIFKMPRKNPKDYTQMQIKKSTLKDLSKLKIHPNQSYDEVIKGLVEQSKGEENEIW